MDLKKYESKSVTPVDDYQCTLSDDLLEILRKEIRETEEIRNHGIKAMRDWVMQNPRIKRCRLDSIWILKHLRFRKHSIPLAQEAMERHLVIRQGSYGQQYFHLEADILRPCIKALFDDHPVCILRDRDEGGRPIVFIRIPKINPDRECILKDIMTALAAGIDMLSNIEEFHIRGVVYILDVSGWSSKYLKILPIENLQKLAYNSEKCATGRHKGFHIVNVPKALTFFADLGLKLSPQKAKERMRFYKSFDDLKVINRRSLPLEYGGSIPMKVLADEFWEMLVKTRPTFMQNSAMRVAEEMYPKACMEGSVAMLSVPLSSTDLFEKATQCGDDAVFGVQGSFRKMEID